MASTLDLLYKERSYIQVILVDSTPLYKHRATSSLSESFFLGFWETLYFTSMDELTKQWKGLSLSQREGPTFRMRPNLATTEYIIAAKFLTKRALNMDAIAATFQPLWRSRNGFKLKNIRNYIVLFIFDSKADVDNILANEPWSYDKNLMVLQRYEADSEVEDLTFNLTHFWVQVHVFQLGS
ncbi:hypothetical protein SO802_007327 [Lithocarpus litseifolius]|uniref:DUF4283 domain-containing protein n=1 Tax=Lithocarpus litseifolius TaxID=425828 RepID=A0AAW2DRW5_9ROSI